MNHSSTLLISEPPLQVLPSLAQKIGLNEAIVLQQLHYWLNNPKAGEIRNGEKWIYNSYAEWRENFPFWSERTIQRAFLSLEGQGLVIAEQLERARWEHKKYYRINYAKLAELEVPERHERSCQDGTTDGANLALSTLNRDYTETTPTENGGGEKNITKATPATITEELAPFCGVFEQLSGQSYSGLPQRNREKWSEVFRGWVEAGLEITHIRAAYAHLTREGGIGVVVSPAALTNTAVAMKGHDDVYHPERRLVHAEPPNPNGVPAPRRLVIPPAPVRDRWALPDYTQKEVSA